MGTAMKKQSIPHWIRHTHFLRPDEYECSACGAVFRRRTDACPKCGVTLRSVSDRQEWLDEAIMLDVADEDWQRQVRYVTI